MWIRFITIFCLLSVLPGLHSCVSSEGVFGGAREKVQLSHAIGAGIFEDVFSFDLYSEAGVIHALLAGKLDTKDSGVVYLRSSDKGESWSVPAWVYRQKSPPVISRRGNEVQLAVYKNQMVAAWRVEDELPGVGPMMLASSSDRGQSWTVVESPAVGDITRNQGYMDLAADGAGHFHLVWLDDREENGNTQGLRYAQSADGGRSWGREITLANKTCTCCWNSLAVADDQTLNVLFRGVEPRDMSLIQSYQGAAWSQPHPVGAFNWQFVGCPHEGGGLALSGTDYHAVVWTGLDSQAGLYYLFSGDAGRHWQSPLKMGEGFSRHGDVAVSEASEVALVWDSMSGDGSAIMAQSSARGSGRWDDAVTLTKPGVFATHPRVVSTGGGFQAFWTEKQASGISTWVMANF